MTVIDDCPADLVRVDPAGPGLTRRRRGRGFSYHDAAGAAIADPAEVARLKALVIPPAWQDVWISPDPRGHIQALGTDAAGRRQYRYHEDWRRARDVVKYDRVLALGARLGDVRAEVVRRLGEPGLGRDRVLAGGVPDARHRGVPRRGASSTPRATTTRTARSGSPRCAASTSASSAGAVVFAYPAKGGIPRELALRDPLLHRVVGSLLRRKGGGEELLAYKVGRDWCDVQDRRPQQRGQGAGGGGPHLQGPAHVERDRAGGRRAGGRSAADGVPRTVRGRKRVVTAAVKQVSEHLGNTPTVARSSYVDAQQLRLIAEGAEVALHPLDLAHGEPAPSSRCCRP